MADLAGSPYVELRFDAAGILADGDDTALKAALAADGVENLVVLSHGWKFEPPGPRLFYGELWPQVLAKLGGDPSKIVVAGVVWPSKRYTTGIDASRIQAAPAASVTLAADGGEATEDLSDDELAAALADALDEFGEATGPLAEARAAYQADPRRQTAEALIRAAVDAASMGTDDDELKGAAAGLKELPEDIGSTLAAFASPPLLEPTPEAAQTLGLGGALRGFFGGPRAAVVRVLEQLSYFEMKVRAGLVGRGLGNVLSMIDPPRATRLHLVGHSFGARVVTAAASTFRPTANLSLFSLTLLQGAFSHNAMSASRGGAFPGVVGKPTGPIAITHTHNDWACTVMYAIASRLSNDVTKRLGDADDKFGSMGANGAQFDAGEVVAEVGGVGPSFTPARGKITNFRADGYIKDPADAHNDVRNATVGALVAAVLRA
jgi:hypothetical protein